MTRDAQLLECVGLAMYGEAWRMSLAKALGSSTDRAVRRWLAGEQEVPDGVWRDLHAVCQERQDRINYAILDIESRITVRADR